MDPSGDERSEQLSSKTFSSANVAKPLEPLNKTEPPAKVEKDVVGCCNIPGNEGCATFFLIFSWHSHTILSSHFSHFRAQTMSSQEGIKRNLIVLKILTWILISVTVQRLFRRTNDCHCAVKLHCEVDMAAFMVPSKRAAPDTAHRSNLSVVVSVFVPSFDLQSCASPCYNVKVWRSRTSLRDPACMPQHETGSQKSFCSIEMNLHMHSNRIVMPHATLNLQLFKIRVMFPKKSPQDFVFCPPC